MKELMKRSQIFIANQIIHLIDYIKNHDTQYNIDSSKDIKALKKLLKKWR